MELTAVIHSIRPRNPFRTARAEKTQQANVYVRVMDDGVAGYGECAPQAFYQETAGDVVSRLDLLAAHMIPRSVNSVEEIEQLWEESWTHLHPSRAAQSAFDMALWDLVGKKREVTASQLAFRTRPQELESFATIGIVDPKELDSRLEELGDFTMIKLKLGSPLDDEILAAVRNKTTARLCVDANCGWGGRNIAAESELLAGMRVLFIEQPLPPSEDSRMKFITLASSLPIIADESCVTVDDVSRLRTFFSGINIKLTKCGGITPALRMVKMAKKQKNVTMVGCMLESSCGIAAAAVVAQQTDYADLDGAWLLAEDPFEGTLMANGFLQLSGAPGLGVEPVAEIFNS